MEVPRHGCPFMCNGLTCRRPLAHDGHHFAVHQTIRGIPSLDVRLWWDDQWCNQDLQSFAERSILMSPHEEGQA